MDPKNKKIMIGIATGLAVIAIALLAFFLGRSTSGSTTVTAATTPAKTVTTVQTVTAATPPATTTSTTDETPVTPAQGPYSTMGAATSFVEAGGDMSVINPGTTWIPGATLKVIHATPVGGASYGGDFYYFFVDGYLVGEYDFTSAQNNQVLSDTAFAVTFNVYLPSDPHCCPSGGTSTVQFSWDGSSLVVSGSMQGANM